MKRSNEEFQRWPREGENSFYLGFFHSVGYCWRRQLRAGVGTIRRDPQHGARSLVSDSRPKGCSAEGHGAGCRAFKDLQSGGLLNQKVRVFGEVRKGLWVLGGGAGNGPSTPSLP